MWLGEHARVLERTCLPILVCMPCLLRMRVQAHAEHATAYLHTHIVARECHMDDWICTAISNITMNAQTLYFAEPSK